MAIQVIINLNEVTRLSDGDFVAHLDVENLIDIYESAEGLEYVTYREHEDPQTDHDEPIRKDVKADIVIEALTNLFESGDLIDYVKKYASEHESKIQEMNEKRNQDDRDQAYTEYMLDRMED